jgi:DNA polymerase-1
MNCHRLDHTSRLLIVDGHAFAYRAFHAIRQLSSPTGVPTNAIYGFIKMLDKMRVTVEPTHLLVVWDGGLAAERVEAWPEYKAQRPPTPLDLEHQIEGLFRYLEASRLASYCQDGVEADDWIAAMTRQAVAAGLPVVIASSDKDFMQLVCSAHVGLLNPNDKSERIWTAQDVRGKTGVAPEQIVDWLSLIGDHVDNIPGVTGVGPKTAADLLQQFGTIETLYSRLAEVKSEKLRASLQTAYDAVIRNQRLIRLRDDLTDVWPLEKTSLQAPDIQRLKILYAEWGFKSMLADISAEPLQSELF